MNYLRVWSRPHVGWLAGALLVYGMLALLAMFALPESQPLRLPILLILYLCAAVFAAAAIYSAYRKEEGLYRRLWATIGVGIVLRVFGDLGWAAYTSLDFPAATDLLYQTAWVSSYVLLFAALAMFVARINRRLALLAAIDSLAVAMTVGIMAYYFVVQPVLSNPEGLVGEVFIGPPAFVPELFRRPIADITLFFLSLTVLSSEYKPRSAGLVSAAFLSFCAADTLLLHQSAVSTTYAVDNLLGVFWAIGLILLGLAALSSVIPSLVSPGAEPESQQEEPARPWWAIIFWLGPLSPATLYGLLLIWVLIFDTLPAYVLVGAILLLLYLAFRISVLMYINRTLTLERENEARRAERGRIASELDSTLRSTVYAVPSLLESYRETRSTNPEAAEEILRHTEEEARQASYRFSYPVRELQTLSGETAIGPDLLVNQLLSEVESTFGMNIHRYLEASPRDLTSYELASTYRIASEALWNAAKHSHANNIWVSSKYVGSVFLVKIHDDGRGFDSRKPQKGLGISLMRGRAADMGATLDLISKPGVGTTVQIRFDAGTRTRHQA